MWVNFNHRVILIMNYKVVYLLQIHPFIGAIPTCCIVQLDSKGTFSSEYFLVNNSNKRRFSTYFDAHDEVLFNACRQLEIEVVAKKTSLHSAKKWDDVVQTYFSTPTTSQNREFEFMRSYILDYINNFQNVFFDNLQGKELYEQSGNFPFSWKKLLIDDEMPDLFYCFKNLKDEIQYTLQTEFRGKQLVLKNARLVSRSRARILLQHTLLEFDSGVEGAKLIPFFSKDVISVPSHKRTEYIAKVIQPLLMTQKVITYGFKIIEMNAITEVILQVKELKGSIQQNLFSDQISPQSSGECLFELIFRYNGFQYHAGTQGKISHLHSSIDTFHIEFVHRDVEQETLVIEAILKMGIDLNGKKKRMPYYEAIEWLNNHLLAIESLGVNIVMLHDSEKNAPVFIGVRNITISLEEKNDWFDIRGKVQFGEFEIPLLVILNHLKNKRMSIMLPNGQYSQIPSLWYEEYLPLAEWCKIENGKGVLPKSLVVLADQMASTSLISLHMKDNLKRLIRGDMPRQFDLPQHFKGVLRNYQKDGYFWLRTLDEMQLGGCLADDMGLGKTIQTLCFIQWMKEQGRGTSLLVVPTSLIYNWKKEINTFTPDLDVYIHVGNQRHKEFSLVVQPHIILTSYAVLRRDKQLLEKEKFNYIILDEAQMIKNPQSDITRACLALRAERYLILTGTPIENSLSDIWSLVHFFSRNMLGSLAQFTHAVRIPEKLALFRTLIKPFMLRRKKMDVLHDLPDKTIIVHTCAMTEEQMKVYKSLRNTYREKFISQADTNQKVDTFVLLEGLMRLRQAANHPVIVNSEFQGNSGKFDAVIELMNEVLTQGDKVLLFSSFVEHLKLFKAYLEEQNISFAYLDGATRNRQEQVELFQTDDRVSVFLLSLKAGGVGLNLTKANYVFLLDPWWNPAAESQAFDRVHRIGQNKSVFVYKFITENTIEQKIQQLQERKLQLADFMLSDQEGLPTELDISQILELIE